MRKKANHLKILACSLVCLMLLLPCATPITHATSPTKIVNISIIIDVAVNGEVDRSLNLLNESGYYKWNIILTQGLVDAGYLDNATFLNTVKQHGELIPGYWAVQTLTQEQRLELANNTLHNWETKIGYKPAGVFMFQPDTYLANYLYSQGVLYVQGYCMDQYAMDWMSMRGGWQMPYYASDTHVLVPKTSGQGIIVFPHLTWDLIDSFQIDHQYNTNEVDVYNMFDGNYTAEKNYILQLMENIFADSSPFGYFTAENEVYGWGGQFNNNSLINHTDFYESLFNKAQSLGARLETYNATANWFRENYADNPTYHVNFVSPNSGKEAEWYWTPEYRVTRFGDDKVVGYVEYGQQTSDPYLTSVVPPLSGSPYDSDMCIDYSLQFAIDDFGEGNYRAPPQNNSVNYDGSLDEFPTFYATIGIPEFPNLLLLMAVVLLVCTASALLFKTRFKGNRKFVNIQV